MLRDFNAKVGRENSFKLTIGNESLHKDNNENGVRRANFAHQKMYLLRAKYSHTETFINTHGPLLMGRFTTRLLTY